MGLRLRHARVCLGGAVEHDSRPGLGADRFDCEVRRPGRLGAGPSHLGVRHTGFSLDGPESSRQRSLMALRRRRRPCSKRPGPPIAIEKLVSCDVCAYVQRRQEDEPLPCERCDHPITKRQHDMQARVWAYLIAAAIIYIPANVLPMMEIRSTLGRSIHTILGVYELWRLGSWDLAVIVFVASVVVPITKLVALATLLLARRWRGNAAQRQRTRLYELVEFIGQWSMLDVFVVVLMAAMANFPGISQIIAGPAAASFGTVVILTMLAAMSYDPRTGWDEKTKTTGGTTAND